MFRAPKGKVFVSADCSAAEVRTAANAAYLWTGEHKMIDAYRSYDYEKEFKGSIELYSYEKLKTKNGYKTLYILSTNDILLDEDNNEIKIIDKQVEGDKEKLILGDNNIHKFKVNKPGQDLYSLIASKAYNNRYEDNLEFYPEGTKVMLEGKEVIAGDDREIIENFDNNSISIPFYRLISTTKGFIEASSLNINDVLITDEGNKVIKNIEKNKNGVCIRI